MKYTILLLIITAFLSCKKDEVNSEKISGKFKGTFIRGTDTALVEIEFIDMQFSGTSNKPIPKICSGQVLQQKDIVYFSNTCSINASTEFLSGNYYYFLKDNNLSFWKTLNGETAYYKLVK